MRLLITTQVVDADDPKLGFFHRWLEEFALHFDSIEVICLDKGRHALPSNVHVHTLGRRVGGNRLTYIVRFWKLLPKLRGSYDVVFLHMNPEYFLLGGIEWMLRGAPVTLWYNHEIGSMALRFSAPFLKKLFHTSPYAYPARYARAVQMPAGIDTKRFAPRTQERRAYSVYFQGRIAPAKRVHVLLQAIRELRTRGTPATVTLVGPEVPEYGARLRKEFADLEEAKAVTYLGTRRNEDTPTLYAAHAVSVNLAADGNFDKSVLESLATETPVIVGSRAFTGVVPDAWRVEGEDARALTAALQRFFSLTSAEQVALGTEGRAAVIAQHELSRLGVRLKEEIEACYRGR